MNHTVPISLAPVVPTRPFILVVDPDLDAANRLQQTLEGEGYRVGVAEDGRQARAMLLESHPDLVIMEIILPDVDGLVLCADIKAVYGLPILVCSATRRHRDAILALRLGADDFVSKPADPEELSARVWAVRRRVSPLPPPAAEPDRYQIGELIVDRMQRRATVGGEEISLTPTEYRLLSTLASRPDTVFTRDELAQLAWGWGDANRSRTVDTHIRRLRVKLQKGNGTAPPVVCVRGSGYKICTRRPSSGMVSVA